MQDVSRVVTEPFLRYGYFIILGSIALAIVAFLWLVIVAFRTRMAWGWAVLLFPPVAPFFALRHSRRAAGPVILFLVCALAVGATYAAHYSHNIDLGPRERDVDGERHLTLTGWDRTDYDILKFKPDTAVLQMANPDVTDQTLELLDGMDKLYEIDLSRTQVTDAGLRRLTALPRLRILRLRGTQVTDAGFREHLANKESLEQVDLQETQVASNTLREWKAQKPDVRRYMR
jgi:hypothetical protein